MPKDGYFFQYVKQNLERTYGQARLADQGLKVYTTIDPQLNTQAQAAINQNLGQPGDPEAAIVMMDSRTGAIRAMQSTQNFSQNNQFNFATQALRQPGSTFKAFVLTTAINRGINPYTTYYVSRPLNFFDPTWGQINVQTYSNTYAGRISILNATLQSDNSVYTQMTLDLGPQAVVNTAYSMGIPRARDLPVYPSVGLGLRRRHAAGYGRRLQRAVQPGGPGRAALDHQDRPTHRARRRAPRLAAARASGRRRL